MLVRLSVFIKVIFALYAFDTKSLNLDWRKFFRLTVFFSFF